MGGGSARARVRGGAAAPSLLVATGNVGGQLRVAFSKVSYIYDCYLDAERGEGMLINLYLRQPCCFLLISRDLIMLINPVINARKSKNKGKSRASKGMLEMMGSVRSSSLLV